MKAEKILRSYHTHGEVKALQQAITKGKKQRICVDGLKGSSAAVCFASIKHDAPLVFVMTDLDEAGYFYHDLVQLKGNEHEVLFFPSSYKRAIRFNQKDPANSILRTEVLTRLNEDGGRGLCIVTYPDAVAEKVISQRELKAGTITIHVGDSFDIAGLENEMITLGLQRTDYVYEPGQFAVRGSIIDVYSFAGEEPFRIDFFGDEVDSIRTFDVQTQLSQQRVDCMTIVPEIAQQDTDYIPFLSFLPEDAVIVTRDLGYVCDKVETIYNEGFTTHASMATEVEEDTAKFITTGEEFQRIVSALRTVEFRAATDTSLADYHFHTQPQPSFHKNFQMARTEFLRLQSEGYTVCILSDSEKQLQRLRDIFADMEHSEYEEVKFEPVGCAIHEGFVDEDRKICLFTDHQIFDRFHKYNLKSDKARRGKVALTLKELQQFEIGDYVVHIDHGVGRFGGLVRVPENGVMQEKIKIMYQDGGAIFVSIHALNKVSKYKGKEGEPPRVNKLGSEAWERMKDRIKTKVKDIARDLIRLYAQRLKEKGYAFGKDSFMQHELEASFLYEDTPDQLKATQDVKADMERQRPMDRLVCGDVGFGKTEVAVRAAFKAAADGKQVVVLVPTTVLAYQHFKTFSSRLKEFPVRVDYLSRARSTKDQKAILQDLANGAIDIVIGTHKLIGKQVKFKDLGLLIIDEEQKFGVAVKEKLRQLKVNVDTLTMTATPIPRTLQFSLMGARDLSVIQTPPPNRHPIQTEIHTFSPEVFAEAVNFEMSRNGQVFVVNNRINNLEDIARMIQERVPDARICIGHGRMNPEELEKVVLDFMNYDYDVMISTTIVENGIDVPNANTIIINGANNYGLSDLHQMRGRVGRGNRKAFCYLVAPPLAMLPDDSRRRLQAIENFSDLGSGIHIAMQDLDIRGAGNMLGAEQSGFIADVGYETYQKILNEAVAELRESEFSDLYADDEGEQTPKSDSLFSVTEVNIESDLPAFFPEEYVPVSGERMALYRELDGFTKQRELDEFRSRLVDRFGELPEVGNELMRIMPLKWSCARLGIDKLVLKKENMTMFPSADAGQAYYNSKTFGRIIAFVQKNLGRTQLRRGERNSIVIKDVKSVAQALNLLTEIEKMEVRN